MKLRFANPDTALGFCDGLWDPDGFDVAAHPEPDDPTLVEILGLDDHPMLKDIREAAESAGAKVEP